MFYCENCRAKREWPKSLRGYPDTRGTCEICDKSNQDCYDVPSSVLPRPRKDPSQQQQAPSHKGYYGKKEIK